MHTPASYRRGLLVLVLLAGALLWLPAQAAQEPLLPNASAEEVVAYPADFFARYRPTTALDMVQQLPGFQLDDGSGERGFGVAAGNILINDRRPSAKQDVPSAILSRIPAGQVERIEVVRGQVEGIDLRGQLVVANVLLHDDAPARIRYEASLRKNFNAPPLTPDLSLSLADRWRGVDYNTGFSVRRSSSSYQGIENLYDGSDELLEERFEDDLRTRIEGIANFNASAGLGETFLQLNSQVSMRRANSLLTSDQRPADPAGFPQQERLGGEQALDQLELGLDAERSLSADLLGKAILLFYHADEDNISDQRVAEVEPDRDLLLFRVADRDTATTETISRLEFDWLRWSDHAIQFNLEGALNIVDSALVQIDDTGSGPVPVDVPGANTRVEELRGDFLLKDTWTVGDWVLDYGLGAEVSEISQTGDAEQTRSFFFLKPQSVLSWSPQQAQQTRFRIAREAAQLNLNDFVSATVFQDEDLALGNPDLEPETTWIAELSHERRFGELGVVTLTGFHHWISNVQDLLPITDEFEVPGNIGDGRRWGLELEGTLPLEWAGLSGARLDLQARWQDSTVTDPVTGVDRQLSGTFNFDGPPSFAFTEQNENDYVLTLAYRQDLQAQRVAWGWDIAERSRIDLYKVNELDRYDEGELFFNTFIETTRWWGTKIRLQGDNILNLNGERNRILYAGQRGLSPVARREFRDKTKGFRLQLILSGSY